MLGVPHSTGTATRRQNDRRERQGESGDGGPPPGPLARPGCRPTGRACIGSPARNRRRSSARSAQAGYRSAGRFRRHFRQIISRSRGTRGPAGTAGPAPPPAPVAACPSPSGAERRAAGQQLVQDRPERVDVGRRADRGGVPGRLLRGHVARGAEDRPGVRPAGVRVEPLGQAEVGDLRRAVGRRAGRWPASGRGGRCPAGGRPASPGPGSRPAAAASARRQRGAGEPSAARLPPAQYSREKNGRPSCSPTSWICTMLGCCSRADRLGLGAEAGQRPRRRRAPPARIILRATSPVQAEVPGLVHDAHAAAAELAEDLVAGDAAAISRRRRRWRRASLPVPSGRRSARRVASPPTPRSDSMAERASIWRAHFREQVRVAGARPPPGRGGGPCPAPPARTRRARSPVRPRLPPGQSAHAAWRAACSRSRASSSSGRSASSPQHRGDLRLGHPLVDPQPDDLPLARPAGPRPSRGGPRRRPAGPGRRPPRARRAPEPTRRRRPSWRGSPPAPAGRSSGGPGRAARGGPGRPPARRTPACSTAGPPAAPAAVAGPPPGRRHPSRPTGGPRGSP